jgi:hypothetical protein
MKLPSENDVQLDRILSAEEELLPGSGFLSSVMERVEEEAAAPPPIPFPWQRVLSGLLLIAILCAGTVFFYFRQIAEALREVNYSQTPVALPTSPLFTIATWSLTGLLPPLLVLFFLRRMNRGLF